MTDLHKAVFLSYASEDAEAAARICDALRAGGIEVWLDQSELRGGDAWDASIRKQIKACALFIPIISANAHARAEGYFRLEWKLAVDRSHLIASDQPFLLPVVIDETPQADERIPDRFRDLQWSRLPAGETPPAFAERVSCLLSPEPAHALAEIRSPAAAAPHMAAAPRLARENAHETAAVAAPAVATKPSIVVLPFNNMSGDPEQEYFSDGVTEDIITDLSNVSGLSVIARNTAFTYKGKPVRVQEVSRELGVTFLLEGSVRKAGSRVRVTGQLVNGKDGAHVWAGRYDRDLTDIFAIQDEIAHAIVEQLKVRLLPQEKKSITQAPTDNVEAYTYYLRGRQFFHRHSRSYYQLAQRMFTKAVELDPRYARAYAGIADCDSFLFIHYSVDVGIDKILATSARALELDAGLAEAHASHGLALSLAHRSAEAMMEFEQAIKLNPNSFESHYFYARARFAQKKLEQAAALFERAAELKPDDYQANAMLFMVYRSLHRDGDIEGVARKAIDRAEQELTLHPENSRPAYLGANCLAMLGERERAKEWLARALAIDPDDALTQYNAACVYSRLGDFESALDLLERWVPHANEETKSWIKVDPDFDALRSHPRYQKALQLIQ
ncbi:MAG: TPR end-of-group domain-containing protein [Steroidobacteraceae bacterium]